MKLYIATVISCIIILGCHATKIRYSPTGSDPCIMIDMDANITLIATNSSLKAAPTLDGGSTSSGTCPGTGASSSVDYILGGGKGNMDFLFTKGSDSRVTMELLFTFTPDTIFKNGDTMPVVMTDLGSTQMGMDTESYTCTRPRTITFQKQNASDYMYELKMVASSMHIQAFNVNGTDFAPAIDCTQIDGLTTAANAGSSEGPTSEAPTAPPAQTTEPPSNETSTVAPTEPPSNQTTEPPAAPTSEAPTTMPPVEPTTNPGPPVPPTPIPGSPDKVTYTVNGTASEGTCIKFQAGLEFVVPYQAKGGNTTKTLGIDALGNQTSYKGNCHPANDNTTQTLEITFYKSNTLTMTFSQDGENYYVSGVDLSIDINKEFFPDATTTETRQINKKFDTTEFRAAKSGNYKCSADTTVTLEEGFEMHTYNLQYAAFKSNYTDFETTDISECSADEKTNSVVPIAVGAALAGLVVIVLIAYLIGRKRSRQSGYEQV